jgi:hypothetical protein
VIRSRITKFSIILCVKQYTVQYRKNSCCQYISVHALYCIRYPRINPTERKGVICNRRRILHYRGTCTPHCIFTLTVLRCKAFFVINSFARNKLFLKISILRTFYVVPIRAVHFCTIVMCSTVKTNLSCHLKVLLAEHFEKNESEFASYCNNVKQNDAFC